jgi:hypothetical protein
MDADFVLNELRREVRHWTAWKLTHAYSRPLVRGAEKRLAALHAALVCVQAVRDVDPSAFERIAATYGEAWEVTEAGRDALGTAEAARG